MLLCDLAYHSVDSFHYELSPQLDRGWVEAIVLGESRTAKTYVARFLNHHYKMGEFMAASVSTRSGVIGGHAVSSKQRQHIKWGLWPRNNRGIAIIDELSSMSIAMLTEMVSVRSSGIAELNMITSAVIEARVRNIALSNPRRDVSEPDDDFDEDGIKELRKLLGRHQVLTRWDIGLCVKTADVDLKDFIKRHASTPNKIYTSYQCQTLIKWAWSRNKDDVIFEDGTYDAIKDASKKLARQYHSSGGLINESEIHVKLARLSAALASRMFSTNESVGYAKLIIKKEHVEFIAKFLDKIYSDKNMNYKQYSRQMFQKETIGTFSKEEESMFDEANIDLLLNSHTVVQKTIENVFYDYIKDELERSPMGGNHKITDRFIANGIMAMLLKKNALVPVNSYQYKKSPPFTKFLEARLKCSTP